MSGKTAPTAGARSSATCTVRRTSSSAISAPTVTSTARPISSPLTESSSSIASHGRNERIPSRSAFTERQETFRSPRGCVDHFGSIAGYTQIDPTHGLPGLLAIYQRGFDGNPGNGAGPAASTAYTVEVYEPVLRDRALIGFRREMTNDGLGTITHSGNIDLTVKINRYLRLYSEAGLNQNAHPTWRWFVWRTTPVFKSH